MAEIKVLTTTEQFKEVWKQPLPWDKLSGKNILVAGASGLIGSGIIKALMYNPHIDYNVFAMSRNKDKLNELYNAFNLSSAFHILEGDVTLPLNLDINFHYIIDCASNANPSAFSNQPVETIRANVYGVDNLLSYGIKHSLIRFIYISTGEIYGEANITDFIESDSGYIDCLNPRSCYPVSKRAGENLCEAYRKEYGADIVIARPCHIYGPNFLPNDDRAYAQFFTNAIKSENIVLKSLGLLNRSWCYVVDCVTAIFYIMLKGVNGEAYNISDEPCTIKKLAETIAQIAGVDIDFDVIDSDFSKPIISRGILNSQKLRNLGWSPAFPLFSNIKASLKEMKVKSHN